MATMAGIPVSAVSSSRRLIWSAAMTLLNFRSRRLSTQGSPFWKSEGMISGGFSPGCPPTLTFPIVQTFCSFSNVNRLPMPPPSL